MLTIMLRYLELGRLTKVFVIPFHVTRMAQSIMPSALSGAYVSCYVAGNDYIAATQKALAQLAEDGLHPQEILPAIYEMSSESWIKHINETWGDHLGALQTQIEFERAMKSGKVVYGPFGSYS